MEICLVECQTCSHSDSHLSLNANGNVVVVEEDGAVGLILWQRCEPVQKQNIEIVSMKLTVQRSLQFRENIR